MGLKEFEIQLDNPWNTYYAGQTVNGNVRFTFDSPKTIRGMYLIFHFFFFLFTVIYLECLYVPLNTISNKTFIFCIINYSISDASFCFLFFPFTVCKYKYFLFV